jgi:hypothetical protein
MQLFCRALGLTAFIDESLKAVRLNYFIRLNWIFVGVLLWYLVDGASQLGGFWPAGPFASPPLNSILKIALSSSTLALLIMCWLRRNTIFRRAGDLRQRADSAKSDEPLKAEGLDLRITARLDRGAGNSVMLRQFPVRWHINDSGTISLETHVEEVGSIGLFSSQFDSSGMWSLAVPRESLMGGFDEGMLYYSLWARPALRLQLPGRRTTAILSVGNRSQLIALRRTLDALLAESADREASFQRELESKLSRPTTTPAPEAAETSKKSEDELLWKNLIDFSP